LCLWQNGYGPECESGGIPNASLGGSFEFKVQKALQLKNPCRFLNIGYTKNMEVTKTYQFRIYPNKGQVVLMARHFGSTRFVWNYFLAQRKDTYLNSKGALNYHTNSKALTSLKKEPDFEWLKKVNSQSLQASLKDLDTAYGRFFKKQSKFPNFKSKHHSKNSFRCPQSVTIIEGKLSLPKFKTGIKIKLHREIIGEILYATVTQRRAGKILCVNYLSRKAPVSSKDK